MDSGGGRICRLQLHIIPISDEHYFQQATVVRLCYEPRRGVPFPVQVFRAVVPAEPPIMVLKTLLNFALGDASMIGLANLRQNPWGNFDSHFVTDSVWWYAIVLTT